jgi:SOS-response transcriptional repressor LexA
MASTDTRRIGPAQYATYRQSVHIDIMETPAQRLKLAREKAGYTSAKAGADALGIKEAGYRHHENGTRDISYRAAQRYAKFFKTTAEWLIDGAKEEEDLGPKQARQVPLISWVGAGQLGPVAPIDSIEAAGKIAVDRLPPGDWVALQVEGSSMDRIAVDGSTIIVNRRDKRLISGKFYVFMDKDGEATFKRYRTNPPRYAPYSTDPDEEPIYPDLERDRDWQVFGRVHRILIDI